MESSQNPTSDPLTESHFSVRPFTADEWPLLKAIRLEALQAHPNFYFSSYEDTVARDDAFWHQLADQNGKCVFGLFDGDKLIGMTALFTDRDDLTGRTGMMAASYIQPPYRGQGLSRLLFQARLAWALRQPQLSKLVISHRAGNEPSRRANQAFGFVPTGREVIHWPDGTDDEEWKYTLDLDALRDSTRD